MQINAFKQYINMLTCTSCDKVIQLHRFNSTKSFSGLSWPVGQLRNSFICPVPNSPPYAIFLHVLLIDLASESSLPGVSWSADSCSLFRPPAKSSLGQSLSGNSENMPTPLPTCNLDLFDYAFLACSLFQLFFTHSHNRTI